MKSFVLILSVLMLGSCIALGYFLLGHIQIPWIHLNLPKSTFEFSDSFGVLQGLFSAFAVILALIAVLMRGAELKASTQAQNDQAKSLREQLETQRRIIAEQLRRSEVMFQQLQQQQVANKIIILQAKQQYHSSEIARLDGILDDISGKKEKADVFKSCVNKKNEHIAELNSIHREINKLG